MAEREKTCLIAANPKIRTATTDKNINCQTTIFYVSNEANDIIGRRQPHEKPFPAFIVQNF